ncbi:transposase [Pseudomonas sp. PIC25]|uniref:REP-associated tyrosine transposase n=1 Tax=Pseudomonas sp. PIC25 TaxID=1958773 RepID=UPI000BABD00A|nr:transposase [Pseudomonas sp. PIC25]PAU63823.1 transposase [Pseudomonas sp. PIC25]
MRFQGRNLRKGRISQTGQIYLVTTVTQDRTPLFAFWPLACLAARELHIQNQSDRIEILAWVLMPDHLHCLLQLKDGNLSQCIQRFKSRSAIAINAARGNEGRVWQKGFHDRALRKEEDIRSLARYVISNPVRAGLVARVADYPLWNAAWL